jgi:hypothetical protein
MLQGLRLRDRPNLSLRLKRKHSTPQAKKRKGPLSSTPGSLCEAGQLEGNQQQNPRVFGSRKYHPRVLSSVPKPCPPPLRP